MTDEGLKELAVATTSTPPVSAPTYPGGDGVTLKELAGLKNLTHLELPNAKVLSTAGSTSTAYPTCFAFSRRTAAISRTSSSTAARIASESAPASSACWCPSSAFAHARQCFNSYALSAGASGP